MVHREEDAAAHRELLPGPVGLVALPEAQDVEPGLVPALGPTSDEESSIASALRAQELPMMAQTSFIISSFKSPKPKCSISDSSFSAALKNSIAILNYCSEIEQSSADILHISADMFLKIKVWINQT